MDIQLPKLHNASTPSPSTLPTGTRVYRRPSPPPSQQPPVDSASPQRLPLGPPPTPSATAFGPRRLAVPPQPGWLHRMGWLVLPTTVVAVLLSLAAIWLVSRSTAIEASRGYDDVAQAVGASDGASVTRSPGSAPEAIALSADLHSTLFEDSFSDFADASSKVKLTGASLLASRYYELQTNDAGQVIAARMPTQNDSGRFGPAMDEIAALLELPHLERLDLGNTLASAAVPVANRHPQLKVLVLHDQADAASLRRAKDGLQVVIVDQVEGTADERG